MKGCLKSMKEIRLKGIIYVTDELNVKYSVCLIEQTSYEDGTFRYSFRPFYNVIDLLNPLFFQGIPGLNLHLRKSEYVRENKTPTFIYERTPQENRQDLWEILEEANMKYLDKLEWLIKTDKIYTGDNLTVEEYNIANTKNTCKNIVYGDKIIMEYIRDLGKSNYEIYTELLKIITLGAYLEAKDFVIDDRNRLNMYTLIYTLYRNENIKRRNLQRKGIQKAITKKTYKGRKKIKVSLPKLEEAMKKLGLKSKSTLYRRIREFKSSMD